jgi:ABC-type multidrug transport system fused ATPase/permease subunit
MIAQMLVQTYASFTRIDKYLNEDEVPNWVSWQSDARTGSLDPNAPFDDRIGCENATFKWTLPNSGAGNEKKPLKMSWLARVKNLFGRKSGAQLTDDQGATAEAGENEPPKEFELKNIDVNFKRGKLNLVSGPTGSGKSSCASSITHRGFPPLIDTPHLQCFPHC